MGRIRSILLSVPLAAFCGCAGHGGVARVEAIEPAPATTPMAAEHELRRIELTAPLLPGQILRVDNPYGDVRLRFGGYEPMLEIHGVQQQPADAPVMEFTPGPAQDGFRVAPHLPEGELLAPGQRIDLVVFVPVGHPVHVRTERGLIEARGIRADIDLDSTSGDIALRGISGAVQARTGGAGAIEASLEHAPPGSDQRFQTVTGALVLAVHDELDARIHMTTSAVFATEYSLTVSHRPGQEPNKEGLAVIGEPKADVRLQSRRGEIRLLRRGQFTPVAAESTGTSESREGAMKNAQAP